MAQSNESVANLTLPLKVEIDFDSSFDLRLNDRLECLTLAVGNAKSHPVSSTGRIESAIEFLSELEEKLDVAKVQLEVFSLLRPHIQDDPVVGQKIALLDTRLFDISELFFQYGLPFDFPDIKLLCLYTSEHRDENLVRSIWKQVFDDSGSPFVPKPF